VAELGKNIDLASTLLMRGDLVAIPTETVYGLAANALNEMAVLSIFEVKARPFFDPLIIHVHSIEALSQYAELHDVRLVLLANTFWPGPLTLLLPKKNAIPNVVTSGLEQVAVRIPNHLLTLELLKKLGVPLAAPSANPFGYISPTEAKHVIKQLGNKLAYVLDGGSCDVGLESTIVGVEDGELCVFRLGGLAIEEIEKIVGRVQLRLNNSSNPKAPGQLKSHYAPKKPVLIGNINQLIKENTTKKIDIICFGEKEYTGNELTIFNLSPTENLKEAAINLFAFLRLGDESDADLIIAELLPEIGLGRAINDRLKRASAPPH
jgi:L-threonylcarbamoyladenylate synthase